MPIFIYTKTSNAYALFILPERRVERQMERTHARFRSDKNVNLPLEPIKIYFRQHLHAIEGNSGWIGAPAMLCATRNAKYKNCYVWKLKVIITLSNFRFDYILHANNERGYSMGAS